MNGARKSRLRSFVKKVETAIASGDKNAAKQAFADAAPEMQRGASKLVMNQVRRNPDAELQRIQLGMFPNSGGLPVSICLLMTTGRPPEFGNIPR